MVCGCAVSRRSIDVCYCDMFSVVNVYLDHLKFCVVFLSPFMLTCSMMKFLSILLLGLCAYVGFVVCEVVVVTVMHVLLFVLHVCMLRDC